MESSLQQTTLSFVPYLKYKVRCKELTAKDVQLALDELSYIASKARSEYHNVSVEDISSLAIAHSLLKSHQEADWFPFESLLRTHYANKSVIKQHIVELAKQDIVALRKGKTSLEVRILDWIGFQDSIYEQVRETLSRIAHSKQEQTKTTIKKTKQLATPIKGNIEELFFFALCWFSLQKTTKEKLLSSIAVICICLAGLIV